MSLLIKYSNSYPSFQSVLIHMNSFSSLNLTFNLMGLILVLYTVRQVHINLSVSES